MVLTLSTWLLLLIKVMRRYSGLCSTSLVATGEKEGVLQPKDNGASFLRSHDREDQVLRTIPCVWDKLRPPAGARSPVILARKVS